MKLTPPQRRFVEALAANGGHLHHLTKGQQQMAMRLVALGLAEWRPGNPPAFTLTTRGMMAVSLLAPRDYSARVSRGEGDAIAIRDYPVHAAHLAAGLGHVLAITACGRSLAGVNGHPAETVVSCRRCLYVLARGLRAAPGGAA